MPKPFQFRSGSVIYFQGDAAEKIFILQNGKVSLIYQDIETGEDVKDSVQPGEFFGVKSVLGRFTREETAMAMSECTVMAFTMAEFEAFAMANSRVIMKMLKVFSNQMRRVHRQVSKVMSQEETSSAEGLFRVGEYYLKNKRFTHAKHVFSRYLENYSSSKDAIQAERNLDAAENALSRYGDGKGPNVAVNNDTAPPPVSRAEPAASGKNTDAYYNAVNLISQEKYQEAFLSFKSIVDSTSDLTLKAKSTYEIGRCMFMMRKYDESIRFYSTMIAQYPKHPDLKDAMFIMGQCNEKLGRKEQAAAFYKKILSMGANDDGTTAKVKRALNALGV
jgi:TolA-binding protein